MAKQEPKEVAKVTLKEQEALVAKLEANPKADPETLDKAKRKMRRMRRAANKASGVKPAGKKGAAAKKGAKPVKKAGRPAKVVEDEDEDE